MRNYIILLSLCLIANFCFSQAMETSVPNLANYQKIFLNERLAYLDKSSRKIITKLEFDSIQALAMGNEFVIEKELDNWDNTRFHVYKSKPQLPFKINFSDINFHPPVEGKQVVTSRFGKRRRGPHRGIDIDLKVGDPVMSVLPGIVRFVNYSQGHGRTIIVRHDNNTETVYAHLSEYNVKVNDQVRKGQILGKGGKTGNARGSHLHFEIRYQGQAIHPEYVFDFETSTITNPSMYVTNKWCNPMFHTSTKKSEIECVCAYEQVEKAVASKNAIATSSFVHIVIKGDTLYSLARRYNSSVDKLCNMNSIADPTQLKIGQNLKLR